MLDRRRPQEKFELPVAIYILENLTLKAFWIDVHPLVRMNAGLEIISKKDLDV